MDGWMHELLQPFGFFFVSAATLVHKTLLFVALCCDHEDDHAAVVIFCATPSVALFARLVMCVFGAALSHFPRPAAAKDSCVISAECTGRVSVYADEFCAAAAPEFNPPINYAARN